MALEDFSPMEVAFLLDSIPTNSVPMKAILGSDKQFAPFASEQDLMAFNTLGDLARLGSELAADQDEAIRNTGQNLFGRLSQLVTPA